MISLTRATLLGALVVAVSACGGTPSSQFRTSASSSGSHGATSSTTTRVTVGSTTGSRGATTGSGSRGSTGSTSTTAASSSSSTTGSGTVGSDSGSSGSTTAAASSSTAGSTTGTTGTPQPICGTCARGPDCQSGFCNGNHLCDSPAGCTADPTSCGTFACESNTASPNFDSCICGGTTSSSSSSSSASSSSSSSASSSSSSSASSSSSSSSASSSSGGSTGSTGSTGTTGLTTGSTGSTGSTGTAPLCGTCSLNSDCASHFCNGFTTPGAPFCDVAGTCGTVGNTCPNGCNAADPTVCSCPATTGSSTGSTGSTGTTGGSTGSTGSTGGSTGSTGGTTGGYTGLVFSEYYEGLSNNKAFEVFNGTASAVDLAGYQVRLFANGAYAVNPAGTPTSTFNLGSGATGPLAPGGVLLVCNTRFDAGAGSTPCSVFTGGVTAYNGNDTLLLTYVDGGVVDSFGDGTDPGSAGWGSGTDATYHNDLRRNCSATGGRTNVASPFEPTDAGWTGFGIAATSDLGVYICP